MLAGHVSVGGLWNLTIYGEVWYGASAQFFLDNGPFISERILAMIESGQVSPL